MRLQNGFKLASFLLIIYGLIYMVHVYNLASKRIQIGCTIGLQMVHKLASMEMGKNRINYQLKRNEQQIRINHQ